MFFWNSLAFLMIQQMLAIWSLILLPFPNPAWTSESSQFTYCWSLAWRILSITLQACESEVTQSCPTLWPHESQNSRSPCLSSTPGVYPNPCPLSRWCHLAISSSVIPFFCLQFFPASGSFPMSQFFTSGNQSIGVSASASVLPKNTQDWSPLGWTG